MLTVLVSTLSNPQVFLLTKCEKLLQMLLKANAKATHIFSAKVLAFMPYLTIKVLTIR